MAVIGVDIEALGAAVAKHWNLGDEVQQMMRRMPTDRPVRSASNRHRSPRTVKVFSMVRLTAWISLASASEIALRIAGPITGKMASTSTAGLRRTDSCSMESTAGASALAN